MYIYIYIYIYKYTLIYIYIYTNYIYTFNTCIRKVPFVGMTGWAVNSIAIAVGGSSPSLPI